tara:strand:+ start:302 stop:565 length:264 start_codon:yes stop_codon:yes gene_type:complete
MKMDIYKASKKIYELDYSLNTIGEDDGKEREDYTPQEILDEAKWVLSNYYEGGHVLNYELIGEEGAEEQKNARREVAKLKRFIAKWS